MTRANVVLVAFSIWLAACGRCCNKNCEIDRKNLPPNAPLAIQRCTANNQCSSGACDLAMEGCLEVCGATRCELDQIAISVGAGCACVNRDGVGSECATDDDCTAQTPFGSVAKQVCRNVVAPLAGSPARVCVPDQACGPASACSSPDPANSSVKGDCVALTDNAGVATSGCSSACLVQEGPNTKTVPCRFDQVARVIGMTCECVRRDDPFGAACTDDSSCGWPSSGVSGNAGPPRVCKTTAPNEKRCVPPGYCRPENATTCHDSIDADCDGIPESQEPECQVTFCPDGDDDGYCGACLPPRFEQLPGYREKAACQGSEPPDCDGDPQRHPGAVELCNGVNDNCDMNTDENCQHYCLDHDQDGWPRSSDERYQVEMPGSDWGQCQPPENSESASCDERPDQHSSGACAALQCRSDVDTRPCTDACTLRPSVETCRNGQWSGTCQPITYLEQVWAWNDPAIGHACGSADSDGWVADWAKDRNCYMTYGPYVRGSGPGHVVAVKGYTFGRSDIQFETVSQQGGNVIGMHKETVDHHVNGGMFCMKMTVNLPCGEEIEARVKLLGGNSIKIYATRISAVLKPVGSTDDGCPP